MSWQAYVDSSLVGSGHVDKAAIISAAGDSTWASSPGFTIQPLEMKNIVAILAKTKETVDKAYAEGFHIGGERYVVTRIDERSIYGRQGRTGISIVATKQAILVGHYGEGTQAGNSAQTVETLADYLINLNY